MERTWTAETAKAWLARRDAHRARKGKVAWEELRRDASLSEKGREEYQGALSTERYKVEENSRDIYRSTRSWEIAKCPLEPYPAPFSGVLYAPLNLRQTCGVAKLQFREGDDLNFIIHKFYHQKVPANYKGTNYVTQDSLSPWRHEYLGPDPKVVGYQFDEDEKAAHIEWWDPYLKLQWVGNEVWGTELYHDETVDGWVSKARGDYDRNPDMTDYLGGPT